VSADILQLNSEYRSPEQVFADISKALPNARNCIIFLIEAGGKGRMEMDFCCQPAQAAIAAAWLLREASK
jgi:hypothetical protein